MNERALAGILGNGTFGMTAMGYVRIEKDGTGL